ncbi:translation initiation factor IF-5A [Candidatus Woesearchaeota archaeon]|nr:translation initiation factor IF-5A [Candidatus Woesearchaeota archaeon]
MTTKSAGANTLKEGSYLVMEGAPCKVANIQISRPGKHGHAKMRMEGVGIVDGRKRVIVLPAHDNVEVPIIEKRNAQVLSVKGSSANIMDLETYETFDLPIPEELKDSCVAGTNVLYWHVMEHKIMKQVKGSGAEED